MDFPDGEREGGWEGIKMAIFPTLLFIFLASVNGVNVNGHPNGNGSTLFF